MKRLSLLLSIVILIAACAVAFPAIRAGAVSSKIVMITTNPGENTSTSMNIGFHAPIGYTACKVQYTVAADTSWGDAKWQTGTFKEYGADASSNPFYGKSTKDNSGNTITQTNAFLDYAVTLKNLTPATKYMYRIYDGSDYSPVYSFKTAGSESWSFAVTGDFHQYYDNYGINRVGNGTKAVYAAIALAGQLGEPAVDHIVSIGDVVAWGCTYTQWQSVLNQPYMKSYPYTNVLGNHDAMDSSASSYINGYNSIVHNFPANGYGSQIGTCFWYLYNYVLFINVSYLDNTTAAVNWAKQVCDANKGAYKYIILVNHVPAISKYTGNLNKTNFWTNWNGFCDSYKVDLVLAGDHHVYMRSKPLINGLPVGSYSASSPDGTVYLANDSSDGDRGSGTDVTSSWSNIVASHYYRYEISGSSKDITSTLITVTPDKITTRLVYYENTSGKTDAASSSLFEGSVYGQTNFYYGDTAYVYPSDHGFTGTVNGNDDPEPEPGDLPKSEINFLLSSNGGKYKYTSSNYAGKGYEDTSNYTANYIDTASGGGYVKDEYTSGELNDGSRLYASTPSSSVPGYAVWLGGNSPEIYCELSEVQYIAEIIAYYISDSSGTLYGNISVSSVRTGDGESTLVDTGDYKVTSQSYDVSGSKALIKLSIMFTKTICAKNVYIMLSPENGTTRTGLAELEVWGETVQRDRFTVKEEFAEKVTIDEDGGFIYQQSFKALTKEGFIGTVNGPNIVVKRNDGKSITEADETVSTGCYAITRTSSGMTAQKLYIVVRGDVTGDGRFTATDYIAVKRALAGKFNAEGAYLKAADTDGDGKLTSNDYTLLKSFFKGKIGA